MQTSASGLCLAALLVAASAAAAAPPPLSPPQDARGVVVLRAQPPAPEPPVPQPIPVPAPVPAPVPQPAPTPVPTPVPVPLVAPAPHTCPRPFARPDIALRSAEPSPDRFDRDLGRLLRSRANRGGNGAVSVVVDLAQPFAVEAEPAPPLAPWLAQVKASGGLVTVEEYCGQSRGFFTFLRRIFNRDNGRYAPAAGYDVVFRADGSLSRVTQVEFRRRKAD